MGHSAAPSFEDDAYESSDDSEEIADYSSGSGFRERTNVRLPVNKINLLQIDTYVKSEAGGCDGCLSITLLL